MYSEHLDKSKWYIVKWIFIFYITKLVSTGLINITNFDLLCPLYKYLYSYIIITIYKSSMYYNQSIKILYLHFNYLIIILLSTLL